jgi:replication-associated recombination protein RarA
VDEIYRYDKKQQQDILTTKPWEREWVTFLLLRAHSFPVGPV